MVYWLQKDTSLRTLNIRILDHLCHLYITPVFPTPNRPPLISPSENRGRPLSPLQVGPRRCGERSGSPSTNARCSPRRAQPWRHCNGTAPSRRCMRRWRICSSRLGRIGWVYHFFGTPQNRRVGELENMMCNVNPGLVNPKRPFNWGGTI